MLISEIGSPDEDAFGVHQDGLVHVSELAHRFVKDPAEAVKVGDRVKVKVLKDWQRDPKFLNRLGF